ncbi:MAG: hypothetical protein WBX25_34570 [Rhodomicrobium sp.]
MNEAIREACIREGVGLILFDIVVAEGGNNFTIENLKLMEKAERRTPDPFLVQRHLEKRLSIENCDLLAELAHGTA